MRTRTDHSGEAGTKRKRSPVLQPFLASRRGATAVEFALLTLPFLTLVFAIVEFSLIFLATLTLQDATAIAARQLRTSSSAQATGIINQSSVNAFRTAICNNMGWLQTQCLGGLSSSNNQNGLVVDVRDPASFSTANISEPIKNGALAQYDGSKCFVSGAPYTIVVMRAFFPWQLFTPFITSAFAHLSNGSVVLSDTEVFQIEPPSSTGTVPTAATLSC